MRWNLVWNAGLESYTKLTHLQSPQSPFLAFEVLFNFLFTQKVEDIEVNDSLLDLIIYIHPSPCIFSPGSPSSPALRFFQTVSIPTCKGHPGNREAAVDKEINKQKAKGREEWWRAEPGEHGVNYRPMSPKHTPKTAASGGNQAFTFSAVFLCMSLLLVIIPSLRLVLLVQSGRVHGWFTVSGPLHALKAHNKRQWNFLWL